MDDVVSAGIKFEVLGPLRAWRDGAALPLGPVQQRVVLAVLLLHTNRPIGRQQIIDAVWGPAHPTHAVNLLQRHVSALRRVLEPQRSARAASDRVVWTDGGYLFTVSAGGLDLEQFDSSVSLARAARVAGDLPKAAAALHSALQLWRGPACDGLISPFLDAQREQLAERRISALEERIDLDLALGNHLDVIAELRALVAEYPLRERLRGLLMSALYRSGRQADALAAYQDARRQLRDEVGVAPARAAAAAAAADPGRRPRPGSAAAVRPDHGESHKGKSRQQIPMPAQLPRDLSTFVGRDCELSRLNSLLSAKDAHSEGAIVTATTRNGRRWQDHTGGALGAPNSRPISRWASLLEPPRARSGRAAAGPGRGAADRAGGLRGARRADPGGPGGPRRALPQPARPASGC